MLGELLREEEGERDGSLSLRDGDVVDLRVRVFGETCRWPGREEEEVLGGDCDRRESAARRTLLYILSSLPHKERKRGTLDSDRECGGGVILTCGRSAGGPCCTCR